MATIYTARVTSTGGRNGHIKSDDGLVDLDITVPPGLGGKGDKTNPEQLFAAGYAACFGNAVIYTAKARGIELASEDVSTVASVELFSDEEGAFRLRIELDTEVRGVDQATAEALIRQSHEVCPYSNATRGNIEVKVSARGTGR